MRLLVEIAIIGGVIYLGWERPFKEWRNEVRAAVTCKQEQASQEIIRATPQHGAWMWDPNHHGTLDRPSPSPTIRP